MVEDLQRAAVTLSIPSFWKLNHFIYYHRMTISSKFFTHPCVIAVRIFFIEAVGTWLKWSSMPRDELLIQSINLISHHNITQQTVQPFSGQRSPNGVMQMQLIWKYIDKRVTKFGERQIIEQGRKSIMSMTDFILEKNTGNDGEETRRVEEDGENDWWSDW